MARERVAWIGTGRVGTGATGGIEVFRENGRHEVVSFAVVGGWRVEMPLMLQRDGVVVSGLRVMPAGPDVPPGGVTARLLRHVPVHAHLEAFARRLRHPAQREQVETLLLGTSLEALLDAKGAPALPRPPTPAPGRRPIARETLLPVAAAYARAVKAGSRQPIRDVAKGLDMPMVRVRDYVHRARVCTPPLLDPAFQGRAGGELTEEGRALLRRATPPRTPSRRATPTRVARRRATTGRRKKK